MLSDRRSFLGLAALGLASPGLASPGLASPGLGAPRPDRTKQVAPAITVETHRGKVRGGLDDGIKVFKGVPYAAATGGLNRFRPPKPAAGLDGGARCHRLWADVPEGRS
jgi:para-nitrobenzyl esterase